MTPDNSAEAQLQQELREMFLVDTQQQLETYFDIIQQLNPATWIADIQSIYRAIHTIKGGAVTVDANSMLYGASALEDLLSDLRYLEISPPLDDGNLSKILLEAGELLASCMETDRIEPLDRTQLTIQRLETLRACVKECYLPDWNEMKQVHQEFADQGFDLVVLDLEMELANIPDRGEIPPQIIDSARSTIDRLDRIGTELELEPGWLLLLERGERLISNPNCLLWKSIWLPYFQILKTCVKNSGVISDAELEKLDTLVDTISEVSLSPLNIELDFINDLSLDGSIALEDIAIESTDLDREDLAGLLDDFFIEEVSPDATVTVASVVDTAPAKIAEREDLAGLLDDFFIDEVSPDATVTVPSVVDATPSEIIAEREDLAGLLDDLFIDEVSPDVTITVAAVVDAAPLEIAEREDLSGLLDDFFINEDLEIDSSPSSYSEIFIASDVAISDLEEPDELNELDLIELIEREFVATIDSVIADPVTIIVDPQSIATNTTLEAKRGISIPVPIERLDRSAQQVVDTLLTARAVMNVSHRLQSQLSQLSLLTQESSQFVTRLRQLQDNYALLRNLSDDRDSSNNVSIERYRQGYTTIVRLLENMLRMSELGQEIEATTDRNHDRLEDLDRSILRLKDGIETSRLVPFRNLTLRAKAILRDLTNRYGKPAELIAHNDRVELDAGIIQQLEPALLHLLRNAYDRGLETVPQRLAAGKPAQGTISISLQRRGNRYRLEVEDDGRGIDAGEIERIAKAKGFSIAKISTTSELLAAICLPGFSSSSTVNEVSGRGVGMDVVNTQVASVGGKLSLETTVGTGTKFTIEVPAPQLLVPCVLFQVGDRTVAFPTEEVLETALASSVSATMSADEDRLCTWTLTTDRGEVAGFDLANYWQSTTRSLPDTAVCIRTRQDAGSGEIWSIADDLLGQSELLIKPLPSPLIAPVGLLGVSLQSDGRLISILDPIALTAKLVRNVDRQSSDYNFNTSTVDRAKSSAPVILIVDDAALMRRRFEVSLQTNGFIVHTCNDGLEALNWLQTNPHPDLTITDVEMPNMDGFTLIDRIRQTNIEMPILVVSSRSSAEWSKEARRLGASDYLNKGFSTPEMLQKVNSLLGLVTKV
jgi:chemotaxis protein histidine kinase CheA/CheY-like chemotaxis protein